MFHDTRLGNTPQWWGVRPKDWNMRVPDHVQESVAFIGRKISHGDQVRSRLLGTAFFISFPSESLSKDFGFIYLVTARHVAMQASLGGPWFVRVNTKAGTSLDVDIPEPIEWQFHPQDAATVDAAVTHFHVNLDHVNVRPIPVSMFATEEIIKARGIGLGALGFHYRTVHSYAWHGKELAHFENG
jgi:hypothetical protein